MHRILLLALLFLPLAGCKSMDCCAECEDAPANVSHKGQLRHVVLFKFKPGTTPEKIAEIEKAFAALPSKIPSITGFEWGTNNSPEGLDQGYTHAYLITFKDEKGRAEYLPHAEHKKFVDLALPNIEAAHVVDYVVK